VEKFLNRHRAIQQMLKIIQNEQHLFTLEKTVQRFFALIRADSQGLGNCGSDQVSGV
jgi:hypothetical protein